MKLLLESNVASHYRAPIYQLIGEEIGCDFCFGDKWGTIKKIDYSTLKGNVYEVHNVFFKGIEYQRGALKLLFRDYDTYIFYSGTHCLSSWLFFLCRKVLFPKKRVYAWTHGMRGNEHGVKLLLYKFLFSMLTGAFVYNNRSVGIMINQGVDARKLHVIYNSLDYDKQLVLRNSIKLSTIYQDHFANNNKNIVFIGRLTKSKRFDLLLDAMVDMKKRGEDINMTFIGDGIARESIEQRAKELNIKEQIWLLGASYDEKKNAELIMNADLCVSPGSIGLTAIHSLMFGCPVITHDDFNNQGPEFESIQEGKTGDFFKSGNSTSLANTILEWFKNHDDDREEVREACYHEIDTKWNPQNQIDIIKRVLNSQK